MFLDNIIICLEIPWEHIGHVRKVITLLHDAKVAPESKTCKFFTERIDSLDRVTRPRRLEISSHTTNALR